MTHQKKSATVDPGLTRSILAGKSPKTSVLGRMTTTSPTYSSSARNIEDRRKFTAYSVAPILMQSTYVCARRTRCLIGLFSVLPLAMKSARRFRSLPSSSFLFFFSSFIIASARRPTYFNGSLNQPSASAAILVVTRICA